MIAGNAHIGGNVKIGESVWIGPSVTVADGLNIEKNSRVLIGSIVATPVMEGQTVSGNFALEHARHLKSYARIKKGN